MQGLFRSPNNGVEPTGGSHLAYFQFARQRRLPPATHARRSAAHEDLSERRQARGLCADRESSYRGSLARSQ